METTHALLFHSRHGQLKLLTAHHVKQAPRSKVPVIAEGHPLTPSDERELINLLVGKQRAEDNGVFPEGLLNLSQQRTVWWVPAAVRPMHLRSVDGLRTILTRWPSLILLVRGRDLYIACHDGDQRPGSSTPLFHAPLPNVYSSSLVCTGDAELPRDGALSSLPAWESVIFDTAFTHPNWGGGLAAPPASTRKSRQKTPDDTPKETVESFWNQRDGNLQPFPSNRLSTMQLTLAEWMADPQLVENRNHV